MRSKIYLGAVVHARSEPVEHGFRYRICTYAIDIDELPILDKKIQWFGYNRRALVSLYDRDYLRWQGGSLRERVEGILREHGITQVPARVTLVTTPRVLGWTFNPVSFYYCYDSEDRVYAYLSEVNNTYDERSLYLFVPESPDQKSFWAKKHFFVSPFYDMQGKYHVMFHPLGDTMDIRFNLHREGEKPFIARMTGTAVPMEQKHVRTVLTYGLQMLLTLPRIYIQAMKLLFLRWLPIHAKPPTESPALTLRAEPSSIFVRLCRRFVLGVLSRARVGGLDVLFPDGRLLQFGDKREQHRARINLNNYALFWRVIRDGGIGFGEGYTEKDWDTPDLARVVEFILDNEDYMHESRFNLAKPVRLLHRVSHWLQRNSERNSKRNISRHYDLGNEMFKLFLDETMTYSSARFDGEPLALEDAQRRKIHSILRKARTQRGDRILEIGCGWGELMTIAAEQFDCAVTGVTLSEEQLAYAKDKFQARGVQHRARAELKDYRKVSGEFDRVVSVEMIEAVGREYLQEFFGTINRVLAPHGVAVIQVIAYPDTHYKDYLKRQDWIQKHIFPGSHLPCVSELTTAMAKTNLVIESIENLALDYAETLRMWRDRFNARTAELEALGYDDRFQRAWNFYLASCEAEFRTRWLSLYQISFTRPHNRALSEQPHVQTEQPRVSKNTQRRPSHGLHLITAPIGVDPESEDESCTGAR